MNRYPYTNRILLFVCLACSLLLLLWSAGQNDGMNTASSRPEAHPLSAPRYVLTTTQTISSPVQPVSTPTVTAVLPQASILPAALYFLDTSAQIMRLEIDGTTVRQITNETSPVTNFDVAPIDEYLVYLSDNKLFRADSNGTNRDLILDGGAMGDVGTALYARNAILGFTIAPDGKRLALTRYGIYLIEDITVPDPLATMQLLVPNVPAVSREQSPFYDERYIATSSSWSPDGTQLLLTGTAPGDAIFHVLYDLQRGQLRELAVPTAQQERERSLQLNRLCYTPVLGGITWLRNGNEFLIANDVYGMYGPPGLSVVSMADGTVRPLFYAYIACHPDVLEIRKETMRFFRGIHETKSGELWGFVNPSYDSTIPNILPLQMTHIDPRSGKLTPMRNDVHYLAHEILWADDDSGAMVIRRQRQGDSLNEEHGELTWLPSDGGTALRLGLHGEQLQWGK